jgi:hypothetical protein
VALGRRNPDAADTAAVMRMRRASLSHSPGTMGGAGAGAGGLPGPRDTSGRDMVVSSSSLDDAESLQSTCAP